MLNAPRFMKEYANYISKKYQSANNISDDNKRYARDGIKSVISRYEIGLISINMAIHTLAEIEYNINNFRE